jgi:hypothetical protein
MRRFFVAVFAGALMWVLVAPASANQCDPKLQGVCNAIHSVRCTADGVLTTAGYENRLCTI